MSQGSHLREVLSAETESVPVNEQTTFRLSRRLHARLKIIAALEGKGLMDVTEAVLSDFVARYETVSQTSIEPRRTALRDTRSAG